MMRVLAIWILALGVLTGLAVQASSLPGRGFMIEPTWTGIDKKTRLGSTETDEGLDILGLTLGYKLHDSFSLGFTYDVETGRSGSDKRTSMALTGAYHLNSWSFRLQYFFNSQLESGSASYTGGTGWGYDLTYYIPMASNVWLGPGLKTRDFRYADGEVNGTSLGFSRSDRLGTAMFFNFLIML